jgi:hypothetical protein
MLSLWTPKRRNVHEEMNFQKLLWQNSKSHIILFLHIRYNAQFAVIKHISIARKVEKTHYLI